MTNREAIDWLRGLKFTLGESFVASKREALDKGIAALEILERLEKWVEVQEDDCR